MPENQFHFIDAQDGQPIAIYAQTKFPYADLAYPDNAGNVERDESWAGTGYTPHITALDYPFYHVKFQKQQDNPGTPPNNGFWIVVGGVADDPVVDSGQYIINESRYDLEETFYFDDRIWVIFDDDIWIVDPSDVSVTENEWGRFESIIDAQFPAVNVFSSEYHGVRIGNNGEVYGMWKNYAVAGDRGYHLFHLRTSVAPVFLGSSFESDLIAVWGGLDDLPLLAGADSNDNLIFVRQDPLDNGVVQFYTKSLTDFVAAPNLHSNFTLAATYDFSAINANFQEFSRLTPPVQFPPNQTPDILVHRYLNTSNSTTQHAIFDIENLTAAPINTLISDWQVSSGGVNAGTTLFDYRASTNRKSLKDAGLSDIYYNAEENTNDRIYNFTDGAYQTNTTGGGGYLAAGTPFTTRPHDADISTAVDVNGNILIIDTFFVLADLEDRRTLRLLVEAPPTSLNPVRDVCTALEDGCVLSICRATRITPVDTTNAPELGFNDIDFDFDIDGLTYKAKGTFESTAASQSSDLSVNNQQLRAVFTDDSIDADLVARGFYDNATITIALINWLDPPATLTDGIILLKGDLGEVSTTNMGYQLEARSIESRLNKSATRVAQPFCPYNLGDGNCQYDLVGNGDTGITGSIINPSSRSSFLVNITNTVKPYPFGIITFTSGDNNTISREIKAFSEITPGVSGSMELFEAVPADLSIGDTFTVTVGCDKTLNTCKNTFNNLDNFGGFPVGGRYMPGKDFLYSPKIDNA